MLKVRKKCWKHARKNDLAGIFINSGILIIPTSYGSP